MEQACYSQNFLGKSYNHFQAKGALTAKGGS